MRNRRRIAAVAALLLSAVVCAGCGDLTHGPARSAVAITPSGRLAPTPADLRIVQQPIPFSSRRKAQMAAYAKRHYGIDSYLLTSPRVIVEHFTETTNFSHAYYAFAADDPDPELHELPGVCAHFVVDRDGTIYQLVPLAIMCRHTVGLNWTSIAIEDVGTSDAEVLSNRAQLDASLRLTHWVACRFGIQTANVIGHHESLGSPYHRELVPALRYQTHSDWNHADMTIYREQLMRLGGC